MGISRGEKSLRGAQGAAASGNAPPPGVKFNPAFIDQSTQAVGDRHANLMELLSAGGLAGLQASSRGPQFVDIGDGFMVRQDPSFGDVFGAAAGGVAKSRLGQLEEKRRDKKAEDKEDRLLKKQLAAETRQEKRQLEREKRQAKRQDKVKTNQDDAQFTRDIARREYELTRQRLNNEAAERRILAQLTVGNNKAKAAATKKQKKEAASATKADRVRQVKTLSNEAEIVANGLSVGMNTDNLKLVSRFVREEAEKIQRTGEYSLFLSGDTPEGADGAFLPALVAQRAIMRINKIQGGLPSKESERPPGVSDILDEAKKRRPRVK